MNALHKRHKTTTRNSKGALPDQPSVGARGEEAAGHPGRSHRHNASDVRRNHTLHSCAQAAAAGGCTAARAVAAVATLRVLCDGKYLKHNHTAHVFEKVSFNEAPL
jgi:hypothetical protein